MSADRCNECIENLKKVEFDIVSHGKKMHPDILLFYQSKFSEIVKLAEDIKEKIRSLTD